MHSGKDIILAVDYHAAHTEIRWFNCGSGQDRRLNVPSARSNLLEVVEQARAEAAPVGGKVVWIMESTTGWARVKELLGKRVEFVLANVLQMPLPPKAYRRKSDKIDTGRLLREHLNGSLPRSYQPNLSWRALRRLVDGRQDQVERATAVKNWITHFLTDDSLIAYAGLAPGHRQSDGTYHTGWIGGGGTDGHLRYLLIESMHWVCQIPRYRPAFERAVAKHGKNVARIIVARMLLRSIFKMLKDKVRFNQAPAA